MIFADKNIVTKCEYNTYAVEASELGFKPGTKPPVKIQTNIGNMLPFVYSSFDGTAFIYKQNLGCCLLKVFND